METVSADFVIDNSGDQQKDLKHVSCHCEVDGDGKVILNRLGFCEVCSEHAAVYTCPGCETVYCSMECSAKHKKDTECNGKRRQQFKRVQDMTNMDLLNDYRFLEESGRFVEKVVKDKKKYFPAHSFFLPVHLRKLQAEVHRRGTKLIFMEKHFSKHRMNTTYCNFKTHVISWRVKWVFAQAGDYEISDNRIDENTKLSEALKKYMEDETDEKLLFYRSVGYNGIRVFLKAETVRPEFGSFYELDLDISLRANFNHKTIIEFPTIYISLKDQTDRYAVIDEDVEQPTSTVTEENKDLNFFTTSDNEED